MAIKPINNKSLISSQLVNRGVQTSTKDINNRSELQRSGDTNQAMSFTPGGNLSDGSVMNFIKNIIRPTIKENGEVFKVPIMYGNEERWKSARKRGVIRDKKGALLLPLIMFRRTEVSKNMDLAEASEIDSSNE